MPLILTLREAEAGRLKVQGQPGLSINILSQKTDKQTSKQNQVKIKKPFLKKVVTVPLQLAFAKHRVLPVGKCCFLLDNARSVS